MSGMGFCYPEWNYVVSNISATTLLNVCFKMKNRWRLVIPGVSSDGITSLPPLKSARPSLSFKEMTFEHLNETISFPGKPEWKPIDLTLYDIDKGYQNPVFTWLRRQYDTLPENCSYWKPCLQNPAFKIPQISLIMYNGCGDLQEIWVYEGVYPTNIDWGELDMGEGSPAMVDLNLRYDRAYIEYPVLSNDLPFPSVIPNFQCSVIPPSFIPPSFIPMLDIEEVNPPEFKQIRFNNV